MSLKEAEVLNRLRTIHGEAVDEMQKIFISNEFYELAEGCESIKQFMKLMVENYNIKNAEILFESEWGVQGP